MLRQPPRAAAALAALAAALAGGQEPARTETVTCGRSQDGQRCAVRPTRAAAAGPSLLQLTHSWTPGREEGFEPVDGGRGRACRGANAGDNLPSYYSVRSEPNLAACMARCRRTSGCTGVEFSGGARCEVWTRPAGPGASGALAGFTCLRLSASAFEPVDGGRNRACRGGHAGDNSGAYYQVQTGVPSIEACKDACAATPGCQGLEYSGGGRCEVWTRAKGIGASSSVRGFTCLRYGAAAANARLPLTTSGCTCQASWVMSGHPEAPCTSYCCNPDRDPNGLWCFVEDAACQGQNWGYCAARAAPPAPPPPAPTTPAPAAGGARGQVLEVDWRHLAMVQELRARGHRCPEGRWYPPNPTPLVFDCRLFHAAAGHSQDMADWNYFSHRGRDGRSFVERAWAQGLSANGENIAASCATEQCVLQQWKDSDAHCNNMMNPGFRMFAVSRAYNAASLYRFYWTQLFKVELVAADTSCYPPEV